jgi:hypothetical protein
MPVYSGSRYEGARLAQIQMPSGERRPYVYGRRHFSEGDLGPGTTIWNFSAGDDLDQIAFLHLGSEARWWVIADVNGVLFPELDEALPDGVGSLAIGQELMVPPTSLLGGR